MAGKKRKKQKGLPEGAKILVRNRRALHNYEISDRYEAGIVLVGSEVKSLREAKASILEGHAELRHGEAWLLGVQINEYPWANQFNHEPMRARKLLLHREQIRKIGIKINQRGFTLVPLAIYLKDGKIKVELGLGRGKRQYDKRQAEKSKTAERESAQQVRDRR